MIEATILYLLNKMKKFVMGSSKKNSLRESRNPEYGLK